jgi:hypothetical protein
MAKRIATARCHRSNSGRLFLIVLPGLAAERGRKHMQQQPGSTNHIFQECAGCAAFAKSEAETLQDAAPKGHMRNIQNSGIL